MTPPLPEGAAGFPYTTELITQRYPWKDIPGSSHRVLLQRIEQLGSGLRVLDLGFGAGLLARRIRDRCRYLAGVELDPEAAKAGAPYFDLAIEGDLLDGLRRSWEEPFDVVVAGDILEHLPDPEVALRTLRPLVRPGGRLLISLPNIANVSVRLALLFGRFDYADRGILDRTHLRFFTWRSGRELLERAGFTVRATTPTAMPFELVFPWLAFTRPGAVALAHALPTLFGYQFVHEAEPA